MRLYTSPPKFSQTPSVIVDDVPVYMLEGDCYFDDTHFLAGAILETSETFIPNEKMFPLNQKAYEYMCAFLSDYDQKGKEFSEKEKKAYVQKLSFFQEKWERMNALAREKRMSLVMALKTAATPILGAPTTVRSVSQVDMSSQPIVPFEDNTAIGKGNTMDKDMSSAAAVRSSVG